MPFALVRWASSAASTSEHKPKRPTKRVKPSKSCGRLADGSDCCAPDGGDGGISGGGGGGGDAGSTLASSESLLREIDEQLLCASSADRHPTVAAATAATIDAAQPSTSRGFRRERRHDDDGRATSERRASPQHLPLIRAHFHEYPPHRGWGAERAAVRRVSSFTYAQDDAAVKTSKTSIGNAAAKKFNFSEKSQRTHVNFDDKRRAVFSATISKIGNFFRTKADVNSASSSSLPPSREEIRRWADSFEYLLRDKHGCHLFRKFVIQEVSSENLDFYQSVEDYKKLKPGKKSTIQCANEIYATYFADDAPKALNLDAATRKATSSALKAGALPDTFDLAQSQIGQLMAKDSYRRFIQSRTFLDLLRSPETMPTIPRKVPMATASAPAPVDAATTAATAADQPPDVVATANFCAPIRYESSDGETRRESSPTVGLTINIAAPAAAADGERSQSKSSPPPLANS